MQEVRLYVIYDRVAEEGGPIFGAVNDGVALRSYNAFMVKSPVSPEEYKLLCLGVYTPGVPVVECFQVPLEVSVDNTKIKQISLLEESNE